MTDSMKVLQILTPGQAVWRDAPIPAPGPSEVLVKIEGVTTCPQWDLHLMDGVPMFPGRPLTYPYTPGQPGHEASGEVVAVGPNVTTLTLGTRVAAWRDPGHQRPGCYAQYAVFQVDHLLPIPSDLPVDAITSLELAMCVQVSFDQLLKLEAVRGKRFAVSGLGPAGLIAVQMARCYGAREVIGIDPLPERCTLAMRLEADLALPPDPTQLPIGRFEPNSLEAAIDCTGLKTSIEFLLDRVKETVTIFGVLREKVTFGADLWRGGFALLGYGQHNLGAARRALELILTGRLRLAPLVTHRLPLSRYSDGVDCLRSKEAVKVLFLPWADQ